MHHLAIVGAGAAAVSVLAGLASYITEHGLKRPLSLTIFSAGDVGPGLAYGELNPPSFICNHEISAMGAAHPDTRHSGDFARWCAAHSDELSTRFPGIDFRDSNAYAPRACYGDYLKDCFDVSHRRLVSAGVTVHIKRVAVWEVLCRPDGIGLCGKDGRTLYDAVLLATGVAFRERDALIPAYDAQRWKEAAPAGGQGEAVIIGSGLSAYEAALGCTDNGLYRKATMISRSAILRRVRRRPIPYTPRWLTLNRLNALAGGADAPVRLHHILSLLAQEVNVLYGDKSPFLHDKITPQDTLNAIRDRSAAQHTAAFLDDADNAAAPQLWRGLRAAISDDLRAEIFRRLAPDELPKALRYASLFEAYNSPMSTVTAARLAEGFRCEKIKFYKGFPEVNTRADGGVTVTVRDASGAMTAELFADVAINATGFHRDIAATPLYKQLLQDGDAALHPNGGIAIDPKNFRVMNDSGTANPRLYALGHMHQGALMISATPHLTRAGMRLGKEWLPNIGIHV